VPSTRVVASAAAATTAATGGATRAAVSTHGDDWAGWDDDLGAKETSRRLSAEHDNSDDWGEW
jgi:hypothetical protein